jgi:aldehyde:ferredoxin oxidoreductase
VLDQNLLAAISAGGNCLFTAWTFVPNIAYKLPGMKITSAILSKILTYTWFFITLLLKIPAGMMRLDLPMLPHSKMIRLATGMKMDFGRFLQAGERGYTLERLFNLREGITKDQDALARRFTDVPLEPGNDKSKVPLKEMLPAYYNLRGWDENGIPSQKTLDKLDLNFVDRSRLI